MKEEIQASEGKRPSTESEKEVEQEKTRRKVEKLSSFESVYSESVAEAGKQPAKVS